MDACLILTFFFNKSYSSPLQVNMWLGLETEINSTFPAPGHSPLPMVEWDEKNEYLPWEQKITLAQAAAFEGCASYLLTVKAEKPDGLDRASFQNHPEPNTGPWDLQTFPNPDTPRVRETGWSSGHWRSGQNAFIFSKQPMQSKYFLSAPVTR